MRLILSFFLVILLSGSGLFAVHAQQTNTSAAVKQQPEVPPVEVYAIDNRIKVSNAPVGSKLEIYSVVGIKVVEIELKQPSGEYTVNIAKGYYIIRIGDTVRKVAIR
ncbi:flagellar basal body-associated protein FliL [Parabacteroides sp. PF5-5]|uniref:hypothetical protein n=1 Tax=unclassified Parabacteroides TaxID=2649774 RepID=UPI0024737420|nr:MULTISPECIES: hypothetical protein [unclassified Parabacteroides]MDH6303364.1 flagellar basal body-associated protein FliL [Parabacteroides sp. PH5-39]MDH6314687.1 flagellar basal body-associated protein FliL [Parabacteroides sp. PF5-13]MDH6318024.1 flagellar basal body-associated protein FliL [Parabacteroides sp. PH5-13]MDH6322045.1 flagellar basal body-associated protein FliL [Parabacteroides sp. PH5-8]MDH6326168.1 flagellar basal body-associated protein FliL [Parabacteroides sp. PH5-41]